MTSLFIFLAKSIPSLAKSDSDRPGLRTVRSTHSIYRQNSYALDPVHAALCPVRVDLRMIPLLISIYVSLLSLVFKPLYFVYISSVQISTRTPSLVFYSSPCLIRLSELRSSYQTCTTQTRVLLTDIRAHLILLAGSPLQGGPPDSRLDSRDQPAERRQPCSGPTTILKPGPPAPLTTTE